MTGQKAASVYVCLDGWRWMDEDGRVEGRMDGGLEREREGELRAHLLWAAVAAQA